MGKKQIEPTNSMVGGVELGHKLMQMDIRAILRAALNHPDARGLFTDEDDHPWEPLNEGDPLHVGDEVRRDHCGIITTGVVARVDEDGDPLTADGYLIGLRDYGTWHVRRAVQELPTEDGAVIVPADGHEYITATFDGETYRAREAILLGSGHWQAAWRSDEGVMVYVIAEWIDPGTCQVADQ